MYCHLYPRISKFRNRSCSKRGKDGHISRYIYWRSDTQVNIIWSFLCYCFTWHHLVKRLLPVGVEGVGWMYDVHIVEVKPLCLSGLSLKVLEIFD